MVPVVDVQCDIGRLANIPHRRLNGFVLRLDVRAMTGAAAVESVAIKNSRRSGMIPSDNVVAGRASAGTRFEVLCLTAFRKEGSGTKTFRL